MVGKLNSLRGRIRGGESCGGPRLLLHSSVSHVLIRLGRPFKFKQRMRRFNLRPHFCIIKCSQCGRIGSERGWGGDRECGGPRDNMGLI